MKKQYMKKLIVIIASVFTVLLLVNGAERYMDREIARTYDASAYSRAINLQYEDCTKDKGKVILSKSMENENLMLLGSSELSSPVNQNPCFMYPNTTLPDNLTIVGRAYTQSLLHGMKIANSEFEGEKKLAIVVSLQWFFGEDIDKDGFAANFSEYQFLGMMNNKNISSKTKLKVCGRTYDLLKDVTGYDDIKTYAWLYKENNWLSKAGMTVLQPYFIVREKLLEIKDKWNTYNLLKNLEGTKEKEEIKDINWDEAYQSADTEGESKSRSNEFYVEDGYYNTYLKDTIGDLKNESPDEMLQSKEMGDYELFLELCKENNVKPYIILMNTNGKYYDYIGIDKERRNRLYDYLEMQADSYGFESLRLSEYEYEPYFMVDVMHLGWKGWVHVEKEMSEHFSEIQEK